MELQPSSAEHNKEGSPDADEMRVSDSNDVDDVIPEMIFSSYAGLDLKSFRLARSLCFE